jgi:hypothetical protein
MNAQPQVEKAVKVYDRIKALTKTMLADKYVTRQRYAITVWRCPKCENRGLVGFKRPLKKNSSTFQYIEGCALCGHRTDVRHFNNKTKKFTKGERHSND